jgi:hypothetical protein
MENRSRPDSNHLISDTDAENAIIDLVEEVTPGNGDSEEIIELTESIEVSESGDSKLMEDRSAGAALEDEGIIELIGDALSARPPLEGGDAPAAAEAVAGEEKPSDSPLKEIMVFESAHEKELEPDPDSAFDFVDSLGMDLEKEVDIGSGFSDLRPRPDSDFSAEQAAAPSPCACGFEAAVASGIDEERLRAAVESAVEKMLAEKLEPILIGAIEKGIAREIEKLKRLLMDDSPDHETE